MVKEFRFRGKTVNELLSMSIKEFAMLVPARQRRTLLRGFTEEEKKVLNKLKKGIIPETHTRELVVIPEMIGKTVKVHDGRNFIPVRIQEEMLGSRIGEFVLTRKKVMHHAPGIGATRSSASLSVK